MNFLRMIIEADKTRASQTYERNTSDFRWRTYSDESKKNENITTAMMSVNWNKRKRLKDADITLMHHNELKNLIMIIKELINRCEKSVDARNNLYKIYLTVKRCWKWFISYHRRSIKKDCKKYKRQRTKFAVTTLI